ncbi:MAG: PIN domain-containing protein [Atopobiaceae bacterium]|nr:PIN domain-containing protein [Atopobiaceae bacterium]
MPNNALCLLLDTNIWLEKYLPWRTDHDTVLALLREARLQEVSIAFPAQSALDVYQRVRIENKRWARDNGRLSESMAQAIKRLAWDCVNDMREIATAIPVDSSDLYLACKHRDIHDDLEDDLVLAACQRAHASYLVTNDRKLLAHSPIDAVTPKSMTELLRAGIAHGTPTPTENTDYLLAWLKTL